MTGFFRSVCTVDRPRGPNPELAAQAMSRHMNSAAARLLPSLSVPTA
jgi:hypothetical protein